MIKKEENNLLAIMNALNAPKIVNYVDLGQFKRLNKLILCSIIVNIRNILINVLRVIMIKNIITIKI